MKKDAASLVKSLEKLLSANMISVELIIHFRLENGKMAKATIRVEVLDPGPSLEDDEVTTSANAAVDIKPLMNDHDPLGRRLKIVSIEQPAQGSASIIDDETIRYIPPLNFVGLAEFPYEAVPASD